MPTTSDVRPVIGRPDVTAALVEEVVTGDPGRLQAAAAAVLRHWESAEWPTGLVALSLFTRLLWRRAARRVISQGG